MEPIEQVRRWANKAFRQYVPLKFKVAKLIINPTDNEGVYQIDLAVHHSQTGTTVTLTGNFTHATFLAHPDNIVTAVYTHIIAQLLSDALQGSTGPLQ